MSLVSVVEMTCVCLPPLLRGQFSDDDRQKVKAMITFGLYRRHPEVVFYAGKREDHAIQEFIRTLREMKADEQIKTYKVEYSESSHDLIRYMADRPGQHAQALILMPRESLERLFAEEGFKEIKGRFNVVNYTITVNNPKELAVPNRWHVRIVHTMLSSFPHPNKLKHLDPDDYNLLLGVGE